MGNQECCGDKGFFAENPEELIWYDLAEMLGMSVARTRNEVCIEERNGWIARGQIKAEKEGSG